MSRILAIDYGRKRCGLAVTDNLKISANPLITISPKEIVPFIQNYLKTEDIELIIIGEPRQLNHQFSESMKYIKPFVGIIRKSFPDIQIIMYDERFTSSIAHKSLLISGAKKSTRQNKEIIDSIAATIILNDYLQRINT